MSQAQVQQILGLSAGRISKLETGVDSWTPVVLAKLARVYACDPAELLRPPPPARIDFDPSRLGPGFADIAEMHQLIGRVRAEMAELRSTVGPRLEALENSLRDAGMISEKAIRNAAELAELFARYAATLPRVKTGEEP